MRIERGEFDNKFFYFEVHNPEYQGSVWLANDGINIKYYFKQIIFRTELAILIGKLYL